MCPLLLIECSKPPGDLYGDNTPYLYLNVRGPCYRREP